ncbi:hypothetical protein NG895_13305 [Aeoliella sp. ICT_H6.2]|uniref:Uncharacterized protein n=1 Tax=Aeoliella straminimaris TaxID=2954799 RepID=A0A9X2FEL9_9BACT|nr:hypothetical protein [Aeoliella straminimaris]MCO6044884.1 hypothetical protein [Aeoliella straminimaris]
MDQPQTSTPVGKLLLVAAAVVAGGCVGVIAAMPQSAGVFLVGLQSLAAGALLSVLLVGTTAMLGSHRPRWPAALLASVVAVVVQHLWLYRSALAARKAAAARQPAVEMFRPGWTEQGFLEYMQSEATSHAILLWTLDACLLTVAAVAIVELSRRRRSPAGHATPN